MTREEAIEILNNTSFFGRNDLDIDTALDMAINALTAINTMQKIVDGDIDTIIAVLKGEQT